MPEVVKRSRFYTVNVPDAILKRVEAKREKLHMSKEGLVLYLLEIFLSPHPKTK